MNASAKPVENSAPGMLLTARELSLEMRISGRQLARITVPHGTLPAVRLGSRCLRYDRRAVEIWLDQQNLR